MFFEGFLKLKDLLENVLHILAFGYIVYAHHYHDVARFGVVKVVAPLSSLPIFKGATNNGLHIEAAAGFKLGVLPAPVQRAACDEDSPP